MLDTKTEVDLGKLKVALNLPGPMFFPVAAVKSSAEMLLSLSVERLATYSEKRQKFAVVIINTCCSKDTKALVRLL